MSHEADRADPAYPLGCEARQMHNGVPQFLCRVPILARDARIDIERAGGGVSKPYLSTDPIVSAAGASDLRDFGALLANPGEIDAVIMGPALINGKPIPESVAAVLMRSGTHIEVLGENEAREMYDAFRNGVCR